MKREPITYTFYRMHPIFFTGYSFVFLLWFSLLLIGIVEFLDPLGFLLLGLFIPSSIYAVLHRLWLRIKDPKGEIDDAIKSVGVNT